MSTESLPVVSKPYDSAIAPQLAARYGIAPTHFADTLHWLYARHLLCDNDVDPAITNAREHYEAFARSVRDILSQRWVLTNKTYHHANPKRVYYLSMEFLIGRSLSMGLCVRSQVTKPSCMGFRSIGPSWDTEARTSIHSAFGPRPRQTILTSKRSALAISSVR